MQAFDIRITGETSEGLTDLVTEILGELIARGGRVHHASINGRSVEVDIVKVRSSDPVGDRSDQKGE